MAKGSSSGPTSLGQHVAMPNPGAPFVDPNTGLLAPTAYPFVYGLWARTGGGSVNVASSGEPGLAAVEETVAAQGVEIAEILTTLGTLQVTVVPAGAGYLLAASSVENSPVLVSVGTGLTYDTSNGMLSGALVGVSTVIGGSVLALGASITTTVSVIGATTSMGVVVTPQTYPGDSFTWRGYVSAPDVVTVVLVCLFADTPTASAYNVRVIP